MTRAAILLSILLLLGATGARAEIIIGVAGPLTGNFALFGEQMRRGAAAAVEDLNRAGGVNGETLSIEAMDDACGAQTADAVANQLTGRSAAMVVGHLCLSASQAAAVVYASNDVIQISPGTTWPAFTEQRPGPGVMRVAGRDDEQGQIAGEFLANTFADENIAIIHDRSTYGKDLADATRHAMNRAGKDELLVDSYETGERDFSTLASRLNAANIDVVFVGGYHTEAGLIKRQMVDEGMDTILVGGDALLTDEYWSIAGDAANGTLMTFSPDPSKNPEAADVVARLEARGIAPEGFVLYAYAAVEAWAEAAKRAGSTAFAPVVAELSSGTFETVLGELSFDDKGDVALPGFVVYQWQDGAYDYYSDDAM